MDGGVSLHLLDGAQQVRAVEDIECEHDVEALIRAINMLR